MKQELMEDILKEAPLLRETIEKYGDMTLDEYCAYLAKEGQDVTWEIMETEDVADAVRDYLTPLVGGKLAKNVGNQVIKQKLLLTANHHEVEFCVQALHGNLLYDAVLQKMGFIKGIVPVFSNTTVNMSNENFPRGIQVYHTNTQMERFPVFPFRQRNSLVAVAEGLKKEYLQQTKKNVLRNKVNKTLGPKMEQTIVKLIEEVYEDEKILSQSHYAKQAVLANQKIGKKLYQGTEKEFLYIELEDVTKRLLIKDLSKENSLVYKLLFDERYKQRLTDLLQGKTGCWDTKQGKGTWFFWGIDKKKRRVSMVPEIRGNQTWIQGKDMEGNSYAYEYEKENILRLLEEGQIIPGLFVSFLELFFLRSFTMAGGCFQSLYLEDMKKGICKTLESIGGYDKEIEILKKKKCFYLSGPMFLMGYQEKEKKKKQVFPMGTLEILEQGGIREEQLRASMELTMRQAHEIGIYNFYIDLIPKSKLKEAWYQKLSEEFSNSREYPETIWYKV